MLASTLSARSSLGVRRPESDQIVSTLFAIIESNTKAEVGALFVLILKERLLPRTVDRIIHYCPRCIRNFGYRIIVRIAGCYRILPLLAGICFFYPPFSGVSSPLVIANTVEFVVLRCRKGRGS